jgi:hypothetical protein
MFLFDMNLFQNYNLLLNDILTKIVVFTTIFILGLVIGRFLGKLTYKILNELEIDQILTKKFNTVVDLEKIIGKVVQYAVSLLGFIYGLSQINVNIKIFVYLLYFLVFFLVIFSILEVKDYIMNLFIGIFMINKKFLKIGQKIKIGDIEGKIIKITNIEIKIITDKNDTFFVPNAILRKSSLFDKNNN